jgi:hypothetical protein
MTHFDESKNENEDKISLSVVREKDMMKIDCRYQNFGKDI